MSRKRQDGKNGAALVTTLLMVVVLAVAAAAFMQSSMSDRHSSRSVVNLYQAELAAEAGLSEAAGILRRVAARSTNYITGIDTTGGTSRPFVRALKVESGSWVFDGDPVYLDSGVAGAGGVAAAIPLITDTNGKPILETNVAYLDLSSEGSLTNRYAFWTDEAGAKQNVGQWGGGGARGWPTNVAALPLLLAAADASAWPTALALAASNAVIGVRSNTNVNVLVAGAVIPCFPSASRLPSVTSLNALNTSFQARASRYYYTLSNPVSAAAPDGGLKLNLRALQQYLRSPAAASTAQGPGGARCQLVSDLLAPTETAAAAWGGGGLRWLSISGKYSATEQGQIAADIVDYLDDDLVPTTDSATAPNFLGVECIYTNGAIRGHPVISFLGFGMEFTFGDGTAIQIGKLASSRIVSSVGLINPWSAPVPLNEYSLEMEVTLLGESSGLPGDAASYFTNKFTANLAGVTWGAAPNETVPAHGAKLVGGTAHAPIALRTFEAADSPAVAGLVLSNLQYRIDGLRLYFQGAGMPSRVLVGVVQGQPTVDATPSTVSFPAIPAGSAIYPPPPQASGGGFFLTDDPRRAFAPGSYTASEAEAAGTYVQPTDDLRIFSRAEDGFDGMQGTADSVASFTNSAMTNFLGRLAETNFQTVGELGYIWTGRSWQTLNLMDEAGDPREADWNLLDYVVAGRTFVVSGATNAATVMPLALAGLRSAGAVALVADGGFNVNTRKLATVAAVLTNTTNLPAPVGVGAASVFMAQPWSVQASAFGTLAQMDELVDVARRGRKFQRESVVRSLGNIATAQSRMFTVYSLGECQRGDMKVQVVIEADLFVRPDPRTGKFGVEVVRKVYR